MAGKMQALYFSAVEGGFNVYKLGNRYSRVPMVRLYL